MKNKNDQRYYFKKHLAWQIEPVTETVYVIDNKNNCSYLFEGIARDIWKMIHNKVSISNMIDLLETRYDVQKYELKEDVISFINTILGDDLIYEL